VAAAALLPAHPAEAQVPPNLAQQFGAAATSWMSMNYEQLRPLIGQLPCPLPGLPPDLAKLVDCSVLRPISNSTQYQPVPVPAGELPASVDHRQQGLVGAVRDQGEVGSCTSNAVASLIETYTRVRRLNALPASALHIFAIYERTNVAGAREDDVGNLLKVPGVTTESVWPYDPVKACRIALGEAASGCGAPYHVQEGSGYTDPVLIAERQRADAAPAYRVTSIEAMADGPERDKQIMKLLAAGEAIFLGVDMATNWTSAAGIHGVDVLPQPQGYYGSHALLAQGYRSTPTGTQFLVQNSWGTGWGQNGYVWIPEDVFKARLRFAYRYKVALTTDPPGGTPVPAPQNPPNAQVQPAPTPGPAPVAGQTCPQGFTEAFGMCVPGTPLPPCAAGAWPTIAGPCVPR
jgi:hypothetical protein